MDIIVYMVVLAIVGTLLLRLLVAWGLRINDIISLLKKILKELEDQNKYRDE